MTFFIQISGDCFRNTYEFLNLKALKISSLYEIYFQCMSNILHVEFQMVTLKFNAKYLTLILRKGFLYNVDFL